MGHMRRSNSKPCWTAAVTLRGHPLGCLGTVFMHSYLPPPAPELNSDDATGQSSVNPLTQNFSPSEFLMFWADVYLSHRHHRHWRTFSCIPAVSRYTKWNSTCLSLSCEDQNCSSHGQMCRGEGAKSLSVENHYFNPCWILELPLTPSKWNQNLWARTPSASIGKATQGF